MQTKTQIGRAPQMPRNNKNIFKDIHEFIVRRIRSTNHKDIRTYYSQLTATLLRLSNSALKFLDKHGDTIFKVVGFLFIFFVLNFVSIFPLVGFPSVVNLDPYVLFPKRGNFWGCIFAITVLLIGFIREFHVKDWTFEDDNSNDAFFGKILGFLFLLVFFSWLLFDDPTWSLSSFSEREDAYAAKYPTFFNRKLPGLWKFVVKVSLTWRKLLQNPLSKKRK